MERSLRAENGIRTRGPQLGKLMLYRLSYFRDSHAKIYIFLESSLEMPGKKATFVRYCYET